jgi:hypothetical protein
MQGAKSAQSHPYWIRYTLAFWPGEALKWARDNILIACACSLAPGLLVAGISAAISDHKWRAAASATLLTYGGLFVLLLLWRLVATAWELDRERQRFIDTLKERLAYAKVKLGALQASPPAIDVELPEIHAQIADSTLACASDFPVDRDIFLRVKLVLREPRPLEVVAYELNGVLHGNAMPAHFFDDIQDWGLVTEKKPIGVGTTFRYTVSRIAKLSQHVEQRGVPVEGWLHFRINRVREKELAAIIFRFTVLTPKGGIAVDKTAAQTLTGLETRQFKKISCATTAFPP